MEFTWCTGRVSNSWNTVNVLTPFYRYMISFQARHAFICPPDSSFPLRKRRAGRQSFPLPAFSLTERLNGIKICKTGACINRCEHSQLFKYNFLCQSPDCVHVNNKKCPSYNFLKLSFHFCHSFIHCISWMVFDHPRIGIPGDCIVSLIWFWICVLILKKGNRLALS